MVSTSSLLYCLALMKEDEKGSGDSPAHPTGISREVRFGGVNPADIKGMRAPFLAVGGDKMFNMLSRYGFYYDSSMPTGSPSWPYSLEYKMPHSCSVKPCPSSS